MLDLQPLIHLTGYLFCVALGVAVTLLYIWFIRHLDGAAHGPAPNLRKTIVYLKQGAGGRWRWYAYLPKPDGEPGDYLCGGGVEGWERKAQAAEHCIRVMFAQWEPEMYEFQDVGDESKWKRHYLPPRNLGKPLTIQDYTVEDNDGEH